ncbi:glycosyltransferase family 39 protein [Stackebrandtia nassauensis]|uniref:Glycosyltransferase RgtA/B/C/D-like domain-containing protein n=1 Tax=Stackebrandtia nassauensis (strain DSM 44728 / CIP 108903 / NRRL B-16338 / NBRC 102104 / LLR-40K-21) TaxID=446470 RepID=D3QA04_STANL|nr:glycosyltransferase family 39 protein [Stackebrandtia nassauensis]ADD40716.1 conserved hypothetical protein [Stackebrandtia nassauensis DSM 44728]
MNLALGERRPSPPFATRSILALALAASAVLFALSGRYGFHRDELYFMAAGDHPAWGYVDQPPLTPLLARASTTVFGDTPTGLRVVATLAFAAIVILTAAIARELGARRGGQLLAACCAAVGSFVPAVGHMVSTTTFDILIWLALILTVLHLHRTANPRWWLATGALAGVGLLNKHLIVLLAAVMLVAILITGPRTLLKGRWPWIGVAVAAAIAAPNLIWQATHDWPQLTVASGISAEDGTDNRIMFIPEQLLYVSPLLVPIWLTGWWHLWRDRTTRWLALTYPILCALVLALGGKGYYTLPLLLVLTASGCGPVVTWARHTTWRTAVVIAGVTLTAASTAVMSLPTLPPTQLDIPNAVNKEQGEQVGWPELTAAVATAWNDLPSTTDAVIFTQNYGQASAIAHYGPDHDLPQPFSGHMSYADWGPPPDSATGPVLTVGEFPARFFTDCRRVGRVDSAQVDNEEQGTPILACSGPTRPWSDLWPSLRHFY